MVHMTSSSNSHKRRPLCTVFTKLIFRRKPSQPLSYFSVAGRQNVLCSQSGCHSSCSAESNPFGKNSTRIILSALSEEKQKHKLPSTNSDMADSHPTTEEKIICILNYCFPDVLSCICQGDSLLFPASLFSVVFAVFICIIC